MVQKIMLNSGARGGPLVLVIFLLPERGAGCICISSEKAGRRMLHMVPVIEKKLETRDYQGEDEQLQAELLKGLVPCSPSASENTEFSPAIPCSRDILNAVGRGLSFVLL